MKKFLSLIMVLIMILSLAACGGDAPESSDAPEPKEEVEAEEIIPATIIDNEGNEVQMTADELRAIQEENEAKFDQLYLDTEITITGTVESVDSYLKQFGSVDKEVYWVNLEGDWSATVLQEFHDEVIDLSRGDKVEIKSILRDCDPMRIELYYIGQLGYDWYDKTTITVL